MTIFEEISLLGAGIITYIWLPLLVWTILSILVLFVLNYCRNLHVQYHYHIRLALLFSLPAGLLISSLADAAVVWWPGDEMVSGLKFIYIQAPVEISVTGSQTSSILTSLQFWHGAGMIIFFTGAVCFFYRHLRQYLQLNFLSRELTLQPIESIEHISSHNKELARDCQPVYIAYQERAVIPVTYGVRKPVILLPAFLNEDPDKLNLVLRHELIHIRNHDYLTQLVMSGIRTTFWFHPVIHIIYTQLIDYREMRCDSHVLSDSSISRKKYASVLLDLLPMPNLNKNVSVNMAQESSNIKQRIEIMKNKKTRTIPVKASFYLFTGVIMATILVMSCTDMQTHAVFDEEELDLMTDFDRTGERGYHQIIIYLGDEEQAERHQAAVRQLDALDPGHITSIDVLGPETAVERYGSRGQFGAIIVETRQEESSYHAALQALGMEVPDEQSLPAASGNSGEDFFVVVEEMPELIGGLAAVQKSIQYPEAAKNAGIEGRVYVQFVVNEQGDVDDARVIRGIGGGADEEALKAVSQAKFRPGMQRGRPVRVQYSLPIVFRLTGTDESDGVETSGNRIDSENEDKKVVLYIVGYG